VLRESLQIYPEHPELLCCLGAALDNLGRLEEAIAAHESALRGRFGPSMNWNDYTCRDSRPHLALCDLRLTLGDPEAALRHLDTAEEFTGPRPDYPQIREAIAASAAELKQEAALRQQELARLRGRFTGGDRATGLPLTRLLLQEESIAEAHRLVEQWLEAEPNRPEARVAQGLVLLASGAAEEARACFAAVREKHPDSPDAWSGEAEACRALGYSEAEEQALLRAAERDTGDGQSVRALGEFYLTAERWDEAASCLQRSLERRSDVWATWLGLGRAMLRTGNLPRAIQCYQQAAALSGGNAAVRRALGEACACLSPASD
jgi:tetratricopeptide (TPR) repeat protein